MLAAEHDDDPDADERAEREMVQRGLTVSSSQQLPLAAALHRKPSIFVASSMDLLGHQHLRPATTSSSRALSTGDFSFLKRRQFQLGGNGSGADGDDPPCQTLRTALVLPFCFFPDVETDSPAVLANALLSRFVFGEPLWERTTVSSDVSELSSQFRQLLGLGEQVATSPRLRLTDVARMRLFGDARLWADTKTGDFAGKKCEWTDIHLVIFPHGAILSVTFDWLPGGDGPPFTLSDLRNWIYVAKFRGVKVGVTRGWSFAQQPPLVEEAAAARQKEELGIKLYAALYGGSCVSLGTVANWLVKMPWDMASAVPRRISRFEYAQHYTYCMIEKALSAEKLEEHLFHIRRAHGIKTGLGEVRAASSDSKDQVLHIRSNVAVGLAREGIVGLVWNSRTSSSFQKRFFGIYMALALHCLSERVTLEKLSYLEALSSQFLPSATGTDERIMGDSKKSRKEEAREEIVALATSLVRYRTCMATDDCGGRPEYGEFFQVLRALYSIAELKKELGEEVHDMLAIVNGDWNEERRRNKKKEMVWKIKRDELSKLISRTKDNTKVLSDVTSNAILGVTFPMMLGINLFSMNVLTLPFDFPWATVIIVSGCFSGFMLLVFLGVYYYFQRSLTALKKEKEELNREWHNRLRNTTESIEQAEDAVRAAELYLPPRRGYSLDEERINNNHKTVARKAFSYLGPSSRKSFDAPREMSQPATKSTFGK